VNRENREVAVNMQRTEIKESLLSLLKKDFGINLAEFDFDKPVFDQTAVDSMRLVSIGASVEKEFDIELPLSFLENPTINNFLGLIEEELGKKGQ
jgi:acyl carrier protein